MTNPRFFRITRRAALCSITLVLGLAACERGTPSRSTAQTRTTAPDNTQRNSRDQGGGTLTPGDQGESASDRRISADIRQSILADSDLSTNAHNVKIITRNGAVTLRGPVASQAQKDTIEATVRSIAGVTSVTNELDVKS